MPVVDTSDAVDVVDGLQVRREGPYCPNSMSFVLWSWAVAGREL